MGGSIAWKQRPRKAVESLDCAWITSMIQLEVLEELTGEPVEETAVLRRVRQSRKFPVWRVSHPFDPDVAVRLICWFPDDQHVVVALFAGDKARMGDVFYDSVGARADTAIQQWQREVERDG